MKFTCPNCKSVHYRGPVSGTRMFACQCCWYVGRGFHPDRTIDAEMAAEFDEKQAKEKQAPK